MDNELKELMVDFSEKFAAKAHTYETLQAYIDAHKAIIERERQTARAEFAAELKRIAAPNSNWPEYGDGGYVTVDEITNLLTQKEG